VGDYLATEVCRSGACSGGDGLGSLVHHLTQDGKSIILPIEIILECGRE